MAPARSLLLPGRATRPLAVMAALVGVLAAGCTSGHRAPTATGSSPAAATSIAAASSAPASSAGPTPASPAPAPAAGLAPASSASAGPTASAASASARPVATTAASDGFTASSTTVTAAELGKSWHAGCPVGPGQLRTVTLTYWGFDDAPHSGALVVSAAVVSSVTRAFHTLFTEHFPIRGMQPTSVFDGSDDASMAVDNTSAFNCRYAVATGTPRWSAHAYGKAVDINTIENPYLLGGKVLPPMGAPYLKRTPYRPGMAVPGGQLVKAFAAVGWQWGGRWTSSPDYQHFSADGG